MNRKKSTALTLLLILIAIAIAVIPMFLNFGDPDAEEPFGGTDAGAETIVAEQNPDYEPWFDPIVSDLPGEVESGLFALQAALGAGFLGYVLGVYRGRARIRTAAAGPETEPGPGKRADH
ncbi:energy-coupling factor ABC transporter substrate-binding protein [Corynebacterium pacaense]|uniref:energy-coupling factor ABC transporter substrate-binding protein n=1 Tax=Corynebacterium pacaense TaxID=1816684 RepID=UPI0009BA12A1|nr:energy-coupling factor ABC transporter substrate-binding protein [Corynebacterium pacaense]